MKCELELEERRATCTCTATGLFELHRHCLNGPLMLFALLGLYLDCRSGVQLAPRLTVKAEFEERELVEWPVRATVHIAQRPALGYLE